MGLERYVVEAVILEGRSRRDVARSAGISKGWVDKLVERYRAGGYDALQPRSRRPRSCPHAVAPDLQAAILQLRRELEEPAMTTDRTPSPTTSPCAGATFRPWPRSGASSSATG